jgi:3-hydroxyacyl-CoA dehydrogenase/enoyl-CoA hydratase/3-hydroxybutyryl-CoA epimerase/3-hydroxyacyl-CoA dehydrogenase/enoyl-CoA hydratase/3-hydroxybutyryl-CoA epimerase/enoyl-CoA isomerase
MKRALQDRDRGDGQPPLDLGVAQTFVSPVVIRRAGVLGAGQMGAGIAATLLRAGIPTALLDVSQAVLDAGAKRASEILARWARDTQSAERGVEQPLLSLSASTDVGILAGCDVVIEAVTEDETVKTGMFRSLVSVLAEKAVVASNTSTIPITRLARSWPHPERFAGMHFFHPVHRMELVEVIRGKATSEETIETLVALARRLGKTPIVVRDGPGFLTTRVLFPYLSQAMQLLEEGAEMDAIDEAAIGFGMPTGPIALLDFVGLDTVLAISKVMAEGFPDRAAVSPLLVEMVQAGRQGQKSGAGFRMYERKGSRGLADPSLEPVLARHRKGRSQPDQETMIDRLFLPMLLEAIRVLEEGIVGSPADADLAVVLGLGFPASRGGLLAWCDSQGAGSITTRLERYQPLGLAFDPPATLLRLAAARGSFMTASHVART